MIRITETLSISEDELSFSASRSSGPGGQNVNKVNTKIILSFDVKNSPHLSDQQKKLITRWLANRINKEGVLRIARQSYRSQSANREEAVEHLVKLLREALRKRKPRRRTAVPRAAKQRRRQEKARRSGLKRRRSKAALGDDSPQI